MCALRAIIVAKVFYDKNPTRYEFLKQNNKYLNEELCKVVTRLQLDPEQELNLSDIKIIEQYYEDYQITVYHRNVKIHNKPLYKGPNNNKHLYIVYNESEQHYDAITSIKGFLNKSYFCHYCKIGYDFILAHRCKNVCKSCRKFDCNYIKTQPYPLKCNKCKIYARNTSCFQFHLENICNKLENCENCGKYAYKNHICKDDEKYCRNCKSVVDYSHKCYILDDHEKEPATYLGYIFFDYECTVINKVHVANLVIAKKVCNMCLDEDQLVERECNSGHCTKVMFKTNKEFCEWLFQQKDHIALAHNLKGYDGVFVLKNILDNMVSIDYNPDVLMNGTKILCIKFRNVKIIDSYSFLPMALDKFSKTFGIKELKKGFFPHLFNKPENQNYIGPYPAKEFYSPEFFLTNKLEEFNKWYDSVCNQVFNFEKEIQDYCNSDVELLTMGCLEFRKIIMRQTRQHMGGIDPFKHSITIASLCHYIFRNLFMIPSSIAVIPKLGYNPEQKTSNKCQQWLKYISETSGIYIKHAKNGGELKIGNYLVDGFCEVKNFIYEFHGCIFHGCPKCFSPRTFNTIKYKTMESIYNEHLYRISTIKRSLVNNKPVILFEIWECEWDEMLKSNTEIKNFVDKCDIKPPLNPREAFYGGRTNALKLYYKIKDNEQIKYIDFTSLYSYVQKYGRYPVGHPEIITEQFNLDISNYFGIIKCIVLAPRKLYLPILPSRINGKLVFTLCSTCAETKCTDCQHSDKERYLDGTWVSLELQEAVKAGYKIIKIYEIWNWSNTSQYDPITKKGGLFTDYINLFLKCKQEASDYPENVTTEEEKQEYLKNYYEHEGIELDKENISYNSGMRTVMKLLLNSFWGRFGMNTNKVQYKIIADEKEWFDMISDNQFVVHQVDMTHNNYLQVFYSNVKEIYENDLHVNVVLAAFVTCHARLKLYSELKKLDKNVLYFDTDSIIYVSRPNEYEPKLGDFLGEFTYEVDSKEGNFIQEFVSAGPKNYAYKLDTNITHALVKGFTLNNTSAQVINFDSIKKLVTENQDEKLSVNQLKFTRNKQDWNIQTLIMEKLYGFVYDKRILLDNLETLPYGY